MLGEDNKVIQEKNIEEHLRRLKKKTLMKQTVVSNYLVGYMNALRRQGTVKVKLFIMVGHP